MKMFRSILPIQLIPPTLLILAGLAAWQWYVTSYRVTMSVLPSPQRVAIQGWAHRDDLWTNTVPTLEETAVGFALSLLIGAMLAVLMDFSAVLKQAVYPILVASQTLPVAAIAPLMILWFGFGLLPKVLVVALVTFFPLTVGLSEGLASADRDAGRLLRSMGAGRWQQFWRLRLPGALPQFFGGLRIAITYAVVGAVFAEYVGAENGLGIFMLLQKNATHTDLVFAAVVVTAALSIGLFGLTFWIQRLVIPWDRLARGR